MRFQYTPFYDESGKPMQYLAENGETLSRGKFIELAKTQPRSFDIVEGVTRLLSNTSGNWTIDKFCTREYDRIRKGNPFACIHLKKKSCSVNCDNCHKPDCFRKDDGLKCTHKCECCDFYRSKTVELDCTFGNDNAYELTADTNIVKEVENKLMHIRLLEVIACLEEWERKFILDVHAKEKTVRELAEEYGWKNQSTVNYHQKRIERLLREKI